MTQLPNDAIYDRENVVPLSNLLYEGTVVNFLLRLNSMALVLASLPDRHRPPRSRTARTDVSSTFPFPSVAFRARSLRSAPPLRRSPPPPACLFTVLPSPHPRGARSFRCRPSMNDSQVKQQIQQMVSFIRQEAEEKAAEIGVKAEEDFNIRKLSTVEAAREKIRAEYERKTKLIQVNRKMYVSGGGGLPRMGWGVCLKGSV